MEEEDAASGNTFFFAIREICGCIPSRFKNPTLEAPVFRKQFRKGRREGGKRAGFFGEKEASCKKSAGTDRTKKSPCPEMQHNFTPPPPLDINKKKDTGLEKSN